VTRKTHCAQLLFVPSHFLDVHGILAFASLLALLAFRHQVGHFLRVVIEGLAILF